MGKHWTERLFIENASLYETILGELVERSSAEVMELVNIFSEFQVPKNGLVLDLGCGIGRHSVALAERGFKVVGVDLSTEFIARAREMAAERGVSENCDFRVGDMRRISEVLNGFQGKLNAVINMSTSMGYYDEETDGQIVVQLQDLTAPQGVLVIDACNRDWLIRHFQARDVHHIGEDLVHIVERRLNLENSHMENVWRYYRQQDGDLRHLDTIEVDHRVYSLHELRKLVEESGWTYQTCYGGFNSEPFTMDSRRMVLIAKKRL